MRNGVSLGVLAQKLGPRWRAAAYFSKQLDKVSKGLSSCLRALSALVLNIQEALKFTLGQKITCLYFTWCLWYWKKRGALALVTKISQVSSHSDRAR